MQNREGNHSTFEEAGRLAISTFGRTVQISVPGYSYRNVVPNTNILLKSLRIQEGILQCQTPISTLMLKVEV